MEARLGRRRMPECGRVLAGERTAVVWDQAVHHDRAGTRNAMQQRWSGLVWPGPLEWR